jgi:hypothetical protein
MKTKFALLTLLIIAAIGAKAQTLIAVQNGKGPTFFSDLPTAITNAAAGDTVYIPGGSFSAITINKLLYLVGVGHNPDSTSATSRTVIQNITLAPGADGGLLTGAAISQLATNGNVNGYTISRCNINSIVLLGYSGLSNFTINENIIGTLDIAGTNHSLNNNIFSSSVGLSIGYSIIRNNLFTYIVSGVVTLGATNCTIENNIFQNGAIVDVGNSVFNNNINAGPNGIDANNNQGIGNFTGIPFNAIFPTYDPTIDIYKANYNLPLNSPYKNAGRDGTDIGIYGGAFPWKPGSIPFNPHFQSLNVAPKTDSSGNLKVQITVAAQNN